MTPERRYLGIYLNDHLAGAVAGIALARRCRGSNPGPPLGPLLGELLRELHADRRLLESIMTAHGVRTSRLKRAAALAGERAGRLKLNGALAGYSPLSRLWELEGLKVGIAAKRTLWETLASVEGLAPDPGAVEAAARRAVGQLEQVEAERRTAAALALGGRAPRPRA